MKKLIYLLIVMSIFYNSSITSFAEENNKIQLSDYRYQYTAPMLYGYNYMCSECEVDYNVATIITKPDGTMLYNTNKYFTNYYIDLFGQYGVNIINFPQNESGTRFIFTDLKSKRKGILNEKGEVITESLYLDIKPYANEYFYASNIDIGHNSIIIRASDGKEIINVNDEKIVKSKDGQGFLTYGGTIHLSENKNRFFSYRAIKGIIKENGYKFYSSIYDTNGNIIKEELLNEKDYYEKYCDTVGYFKHKDEDGNYYIMQQNDLYNSRHYELPSCIRGTYDYLNLTDHGEIQSDKLDKSYSFETKEIGGKTYYALFKTLNDNETYQDYIPQEKPSEWAVENIEKATKDGLLFNNSKCFYKEGITRYDFCVLAIEAFCKEKGMEIDEYIEKNNISLDYEKFTDTNNAYILLANKLGIVNGMSENEFEPFEKITRQQAAVMLSNMAKALGINPNSKRVNFIDKQYFAKWASDAIYDVSSIKDSNGTALMNGTEPNKFSPWMYYTREQAYVTIYRLYEMCK